MTRILTSGAALAVLLSAGAALAQNPQVPLQGRDTDPNMPAPQSTVPEKVRPGDPSATGTTTEGRGDLSDKLERSDGVLRPPNNGAGATVTPPVPEPNSTPVIRPPSGDVQPK